MTRLWIATLCCLGLALSACADPAAERAEATSVPAVMSTPTFPPTPVLPQATDVLAGASALPQGMLLFLEYVPLDRRCAMVEELADPIYQLHQSGDLDLRIAPTLLDGALGLYGEADWAGFAHSATPIRGLPFTGRHEILEIRSDGTLVVEIEGANREIAPGAFWIRYTGRSDCAGGWMDYSYEKLINHGLIDREMLHFLPES